MIMSVRHANESEEWQIATLLREARGTKTFAQISDWVGVTPQAYQQWEAGKRRPDTDQLIHIAINAGKARQYWVRDLALRCLNVRYPEVHFKVVRNGKGLEAA